MKQFAIKPITPEEIFTNRKQQIDDFYLYALNAVKRKTMSTVLLGHRRMGKSEIFKRVVNRLFFEQDMSRPYCIPVFYEFPDTFSDRNEFAINYVSNFLRWYTSFVLQDTRLLEKPANIKQLIQIISEKIPITYGLEFTIDLLNELLLKNITIPEQQALRIPSVVANRDDITIVMFLDEFQNTNLPQYNFNIIGHLKEAIESINSPHFVTGSAMSMLSDEILGKGVLYGRFRYKHLDPLTAYYGRELVLKTSKYYDAEIPESMLTCISERCGGNPFYIKSIIQQAADQKVTLDSEDVLNKILTIDICSGFIWGELSDQINRWINRINKHGITKWILYLAALDDNIEIDIEAIQVQLQKKEGIKVSIDEIRDVLIKLARGDLLEYKVFGDWFGKIQDPILNEFLKVWGLIEIERQNKAIVTEETIKKMQKRQKQFHDYKGYVVEIFIAQVFWNLQKKIIPGKFLHSTNNIKISHQFLYIDQRFRKSSGKNIEVDILASSVDDIWLVESKHWQKPVGQDVLNNLIEQKKIFKQYDSDDKRPIHLWIYSKNGLTQSAKIFAEKNEIFWSNYNDLNSLLSIANLRQLPVD